MNYKDTLNYLFSQLPMYQRTGAAAYKKDIGNIVQACKILGSPHKKFKSIHIAGTNGKGSTAHMIASILQEAGFKTGLYTSPHLKDFRERIRINGKMISKKEVVQFVDEQKIKFEKIKMSFFEYTVAMAFNHFSKSKIDIAIIETGLGGRLDSTNIIEPELSIITNIGFDHTNLLGAQLEDIAKEKAGIIKEKIPVIIGRRQKEIEGIFKEIADKKNTSIYFSKNKNYSSNNLSANYQTENINTTITALEILDWKINENHISKGLNNINKNTGLQGRWQTLNKSPLIICDTGHNVDGIRHVIQQINNITFNKLHFVFGTVNDKDINKILALLPKGAKYYFCAAKIDRALDATELKNKSVEFNLKGNSFNSVKEAYQKSISTAEKDDLIFIGGSTFVVAEVL